ncbi:MAG: acyl-CoA dehydrogenase family protein [Acidimicrobiales bacterium]
MDFSWSDEQLEYRATVERFAREQLGDDVIGRDHEEIFPTVAWQKCADFGLIGLPVPEELGGSGADTLTIALALEALGYGCRDNGFLFSLNAHMWACVVPIMIFGTEGQRQRWLPGLCNGTLIGGQAMSEPDSGSDAFHMSTVAEREGDGYVLHGNKTFVTNGPIGNVLVVFAITDRARSFAGLSAFVVERETPGMTIGSTFHKMGLRTSPMTEITFSNCAVPAENLLGRPGDGMTVFNTAMEWERSFILACAVGIMRRQVEECVAFTRERKQFGQPISKFQSIAHRIVEMRLRQKTAQLLLYELAWLRRKGRSTTAESSLVKLHLSRCWVETSLDALYIHGALGYMVESGLERNVRDAIASQLYSGTSDIQMNIVASRMGL